MYSNSIKISAFGLFEIPSPSMDYGKSFQEELHFPFWASNLSSQNHFIEAEKDCVLKARSCSLQEKLVEYGQQTFIEAEGTNGIEEKEREREALEMMEKLSQDGFEKLMKENDLDAVVTPGSSASPVLAIGGYPEITVPAGYDCNGMPFGICFGGLRGTEPKLIEIAYGFEQATKVRRLPFSTLLELSEKAS